MTTVSIAKYLARFDAPPGRNGQSAAAGGRGELPKPAPEAPRIDVTALVAEAAARARAEERALAEAAITDAVAREQAAAAEALAAARHSWTAEEAGRLGTRIAEAFTEVERAVADRVARILAPFLAEALRRRAIDQLGQALAILRETGEAPALRISGPADLTEALRERLLAAGVAVDMVTADMVDITVTADRDTILETQLRAWGDRLAAALG